MGIRKHYDIFWRQAYTNRWPHETESSDCSCILDLRRSKLLRLKTAVWTSPHPSSRLKYHRLMHAVLPHWVRNRPSNRSDQFSTLLLISLFQSSVSHLFLFISLIYQFTLISSSTLFHPYLYPHHLHRYSAYLLPLSTLISLSLVLYTCLSLSLSPSLSPSLSLPLPPSLTPLSPILSLSLFPSHLALPPSPPDISDYERGDIYSTPS